MATEFFCSVCGMTCLWEHRGIYDFNHQKRIYYDSNTGEKIMVPVCPTGICGHEGIWHEWKGWGIFRSRQCTKCFELESHSYD